jgi:hypothetical protein
VGQLGERVVFDAVHDVSDIDRGAAVALQPEAVGRCAAGA